MKQYNINATITIKPEKPKIWYNYIVPKEVRIQTAIKELEKVIKEIKQ